SDSAPRLPLVDGRLDLEQLLLLGAEIARAWQIGVGIEDHLCGAGFGQGVDVAADLLDAADPKRAPPRRLPRFQTALDAHDQLRGWSLGRSRRGAQRGQTGVEQPREVGVDRVPRIAPACRAANGGAPRPAAQDWYPPDGGRGPRRRRG